MGKFQTIPDDKNPKFVVLPFGDEEAVEDYLDELWAVKAVKAYQQEKHHDYKSLDDLKNLIARQHEEQIELMQG